MHRTGTLLAVISAARSGAQTRPVGDLVTDLAANDATVRARAACGLKEQGDRAVEAIDPLVRLLGDATPVDPVVCREHWQRAPTSRRRQVSWPPPRSSGSVPGPCRA